MFTGLVEGRGRVQSFEPMDGWWRLVVKVPNTEGLELGASVAIDGACLTAVAVHGDEVGGHLVSGHVFDTGRIETVTKTGETCDIHVAASAETMRYIFEKGYIAISGISLTVGLCEGEGFFLHLIPETLARTTLGSAKPGDRVNLEVDPITVAAVETVERIKAQEALA